MPIIIHEDVFIIVASKPLLIAPLVNVYKHVLMGGLVKIKQEDA